MRGVYLVLVRQIMYRFVVELSEINITTVKLTLFCLINLIVLMNVFDIEFS